MIKTDELIGIIAKRKMSQRKVAKSIGITERTFYRKIRKGVFGSDEIEKMIELLNIEEPMKIFFAQNVTYKDTFEIKNIMERKEG